MVYSLWTLDDLMNVHTCFGSALSVRAPSAEQLRELERLGVEDAERPALIIKVWPAQDA